MKKIKIWITLLGTGIGAISYWRIPYDEINLFENELWILVGFATFSVALLASLLFDQSALKVAVFLTLGVILSVLIRIIFDTLFWDSTSHNLAPFEILISGMHALPMALVGAYLGKLILSFKK